MQSPPRLASIDSRLVLYVEDDRANQEVASLSLEKKYTLIFAANDREACAALAARGQELKMILMDIELQGSALNGVDLTRLVRGTLSDLRGLDYANAVPVLDTPILFVTAYGQVYNRQALLAAGGDDVIDKPVDFVELHTAMARAYIQRVR